MARRQSLIHTQTKGLLIRSWHWYRRQHCNTFCNIIVPPLILILISVLSKALKGRDVVSFEFQRNPQGANAPLPFNPGECYEIEKDINPAAANAVCGLNRPFVPDYNVPVAFPESIANLVGSRDADQPSDSPANSGLLEGLSLEPFIFPGALPGKEFFITRTEYDGVFLNSYFDGDNTAKDYQDFLDAAQVAGTIDREFSTKSVRFQSEDDLRKNIYDGWYKGNRLGTYSTALTFNNVSQNGDALLVDATVYFNESTPSNCTEACPVVSNVARTHDAIFRFLSPNKSAMAFVRRMPPIDVSLELGFIQFISSILIGLFSHFWLPTFLRFLVFERVSRLRAMMSMMGLKRREYWIGTYTGLFLDYATSKIMIIIFGAALSLPFFVNNTAISYLVLFFLWGHVLIAFAMLLAPFFENPETAQVIGWLFIILVNLVGGPYLGQRLSDSDTSEGTWAAIMLLPSFAFFRSVYYAGALNSGGKGVTLTSEDFNGFELGMCSGEGPFCRSYIFLFAEWIILMIFATYFDRVLPGAVGNRLHPLFFLGFKRKATYADDDTDSSQVGADVIEEENRAAALVANMETEPFNGVVLDKLTKTYPGRPPVNALKRLSLVACRGEVLCILAHNGAGKTTAFRTLVGELEATSGTAFVSGNNILTDMDKVQRSMGVAPQQNILWDDLSVQEHLFFYGRVKNLHGQALKDSVETSLEAVQLDFARKRKIKALSGGMKRRLSVSIAMIGNPDFIVLDEPSTGLDILAREKLWHSIDRVKHNKAILLTTHSLDEAETLSNRVAIMSQGSLKCIGKAEELKLRLGKGHHLSVSLPAGKMAMLHDAIMAVAPEAEIETELGGNVEYVLPKELAIPSVFALMEKKRDLLEIRDWAINQSTLEDVFLEVTQKGRREEELREQKDIDP